MDEKGIPYYQISDISMVEHLQECININGLEGTEDIIKKVYSHPDMCKTRDLFLNELYKKYKNNT